MADAVLVGADDEDERGDASANTAAQELLMTLPGITAKNIRHVMGMVNSIRELCELDVAGIQAILGVEHGKVLHTFLHKGESSS